MKIIDDQANSLSNQKLSFGHQRLIPANEINVIYFEKRLIFGVFCSILYNFT